MLMENIQMQLPYHLIKKNNESSSPLSSDSLNVFNENALEEMYNFNSEKIGGILKKGLLNAQADNRVILGLKFVIETLSVMPENALICIIAVPKDKDSALHINEVLLEAFCYEHDIYVIKVDSAIKLNRILGSKYRETCCLIQKPADSECNYSEDHLNKSETILVDYCEAFWNATQLPIVNLPKE